MNKGNPKILVSHPTGNPNVKGVLNGLYQNDMLHSFHTSVACFPNGFVNTISKFPPLKDFKRRSFSAIIRNQTHTYPFKELGRLFSQRLNLNCLLTNETGLFSSYKCCQYIDVKVSEYISKHNDISGVYAYEDSAMFLFESAKKKGLKCFYELPTTYWNFTQNILKEEVERLPLWAETLKGGAYFSPEKRNRKDSELDLSDILIVPSKFVRDTLPKSVLNDKKIIILPYGSPLSINKVENKNNNQPLRILFVGNMGQNKGLADIFSAIKLLNTNNIELVTMGSLLAPWEFYKKQLSDFTYFGVQPHSKVLEIMATCDVFCFPSLREGRALVMQEAMSQGLPIIITPNTGGEDLVIEGETGFLVPIRSPEIIAEKINWFLENRNLIPEMSRKAQQRAEQYTWEQYGNSIANLIKESL
jgi:glycosyltransferase involved in cell wall biosynthesis